MRKTTKMTTSRKSLQISMSEARPHPNPASVPTLRFLTACGGSGRNAETRRESESSAEGMPHADLMSLPIFKSEPRVHQSPASTPIPRFLTACGGSGRNAETRRKMESSAEDDVNHSLCGTLILPLRLRVENDVPVPSLRSVLCVTLTSPPRLCVLFPACPF